MAIEVKIRDKDGKAEYHKGVTRIEKSDDGLFLFFNDEDSNIGEDIADLLTSDANHYEDGEIETVKVEGDVTIKDLEEKKRQDQEEMVEILWENPEMPRSEKWDGIDSLEEAKAKMVEGWTGDEAEDSSHPE